MKIQTRTRLTLELAALVKEIAKNIQQKILVQGTEENIKAIKLHQEEKVGEVFNVWTDLLSRRAAVLWVLKSVYIRVLEDRELLNPLRIVDTQSQQLFDRLAPNLGETAYLSWVYRDLCTENAGLSDLFTL